MTKEILADQPARDRIKYDLDATLFVEAGAGTGKTTALVGRIVSLVLSGVAMENIAAITFTDRAASELRDRVRRKFEALAATPGAEADLAAAALRELDGAALCTLHAFAQRILVDHPIEAGLPPAVEVSDSVSSLLEFDERWAETLHGLLNNSTQTFTLLMGMEIGITLDHLRKLAKEFDQNWDQVEERISPVAEPAPIDVQRLLRTLKDLTDLADLCTADHDPMVDYLTMVSVFADDLRRNAQDPLAVVRILSKALNGNGGPTFRGGNTGRKGNWLGSIDITGVRNQLTEAREQISEALQQLADQIINRLAATIGQSSVDAAAHRQHQGQLSFHDLLVLARRVLLHPDHGLNVRQSLSQRYQRLLLDEFQDTDPLQIELAALIADPTTITADWQNLKPRPGSLFFVGDPKQSIYGFRRADISLYLTAQQTFGTEEVQLEGNFRTTEPIINWVNEIFGQLITPEEKTQPAYVPLTTHRKESTVGPAVTLLGFHEDKKDNAEERRDDDAAEIAAIITTALAEEWTIYDEEVELWRPCQPGDITILVRTRTPVSSLTKALDALGIPRRVEAGSNPWENDEVRDLLTTLRAIDDPTDELALITALRSPLFGCSDEDLFDYTTSGGKWNHQKIETVNLPDSHCAVEGVAWMAKLHKMRPWNNAAQLTELVIKERRSMELAMAHPRPRDAWRRIRTFSGTARSYCELRGGDLRSFLHWCGLHANDEVKVDEVVPPEPDDNAVRIMTIHAAKGLEFPICILADLGATRNTRGLHVSFPTNTPGIAVGFKKDLTNNVRMATTEQFDHREHLERLRLLYVAATRARDHLVISLHRSTPKTAPETRAGVSSAEIFCEVTDGEGASLTTPTVQAFTRPTSPQTRDLPQVNAWQTSLEEIQKRSEQRPTVAATTLTAEAAEEAEEEQPGHGETGRHGPAVGRAVHNALQIIDFAENGQAEAQQAATNEGVAPETVATMVASALASPSVRAAATTEHWRELFVASPLSDDLLLEGYIDLAYREGDGLVIVDYKTDAYRTEKELTVKVAHYRLQGAAYSLAVQQATGLPVHRMVFCFLGNGQAEEREIKDLTTAMDEVKAQVAVTG
jgi:ATP-dependent exoDNAse (exonuclease V) beta subunit